MQRDLSVVVSCNIEDSPVCEAKDGVGHKEEDGAGCHIENNACVT